jgi:hypothetical protein
MMKGGVAALLAAATIILPGCSSDIVFLGDLALQQASGPALLERELRGAVDEAGHRLEIVWQPEGTLDDPWLDAAVQQADVGIVVLSPYLSVFADQVAGVVPDKRVVAIYGPESRVSNVTRIRYDPTEALSELGLLLADWILGRPGRSVHALFYEPNEEARNEARLLEQSYAAASGLRLETTSYPVLPEREQVRLDMEQLAEAAELLVVAFMGRTTDFVLELLRGESAFAIVRHGVGPPKFAAGIVAVVQDDLSDTLAAVAGVSTETLPSLMIIPSVLRIAQEWDEAP